MSHPASRRPARRRPAPAPASAPSPARPRARAPARPRARAPARPRARRPALRAASPSLPPARPPSLFRPPARPPRRGPPASAPGIPWRGRPRGNSYAAPAPAPAALRAREPPRIQYVPGVDFGRRLAPPAANTVDKPTTRQSPAGVPAGCQLRRRGKRGRRAGAGSAFARGGGERDGGERHKKKKKTGVRRTARGRQRGRRGAPRPAHLES